MRGIKNQHLFRILFNFIIFISSLSIAEESLSLAPQWKVGDSWSIKATWYSDINFLSRTEEEAKEKKRRGYSFFANFEVTNIINTSDFNPPYNPTSLRERARYKNKIQPSKGYECFEIKVSLPKDGDGFQRRYLLYFRTEVMNLIRVIDNSIRTDGVIMNERCDYPMDPNGPFISIERYRIPFDWPDWSQKDIDVKQDDKIKTQQIQEKSFSDKDGKRYDGFEITMAEKRREDNKETAKIITKWKKGLPWWSERKKYDEQGNITEEMEIEIQMNQ